MCAIARRCRRGLPVAGDLGQQASHGDCVPLLGVDAGQGPVDRRGDLGVDLIGRDFDQGLVGGHRLADLLVPLKYGASGDGVAHRGHDDLSRAGINCHSDRPL